MAIIALAQATTQPMPTTIHVVLSMLVLLAAPVAAYWIWRLGLLRRGGINGRQRLSRRQSPWLLVFVLAAALVTLVTISGALLPIIKPVESFEISQILAGGGGTLLAALAALALLAAVLPRGWKRLGLSLDHLAAAMRPAMIALILVLPWVYMIATGWEMLLQWLGIDYPREHDVFRLWHDLPAGYDATKTAIIFIAVFAAPLSEELAFRGLIQTALRRWLRWAWPAVVITSLLFAAVHQPWPIMVPIFFLSLGLGALYERTGNLWAAILMHAAFNGVQMILFLTVGM